MRHSRPPITSAAVGLVLAAATTRIAQSNMASCQSIATKIKEA